MKLNIDGKAQEIPSLLAIVVTSADGTSKIAQGRWNTGKCL
jgi:hypothetical protein